MQKLPFDPTTLWPLPPLVGRPEPTAGGFSGALVFRLRTEAGEFALRGRSPEYDDEARLRREHAVRKHLHAADLPCVPVPIPLYRGGTYLHAAGRFWDLSPWLPGTPLSVREDTPRPWRPAFRTLARLHLAAATFPGVSPELQTSPGLQSRVAFAHRLLAGDAVRLAAAARNHPWPDVGEAAVKMLKFWSANCSIFIERWTRGSGLTAVLLPCIRDLRAEHVLTTGTEITGIVDWDSLRDECVAADLARLYADLHPDAQLCRSLRGIEFHGISASSLPGVLRGYLSIREPTAAELLLMGLFLETNAVLSPWQWLVWLIDDRREFPDMSAVIDRLVRLTNVMMDFEP